MKKVRAAIAGMTIIAVLSVGLLLVNVRAATSKANSSATVSTARMGDTIDTTESILYLYVEGEDVVAASLRRGLFNALEGDARFGPVMLLDAPPSASERPAVVAAISEQETTWTPIYGSSQLKVRFAYASDEGSLSWRDEGAFVFDGEKLSLRIRGDLSFQDQTRGLISRPAYADYLGRVLAEQVDKQLLQAIDRDSKPNSTVS